MKDRRRDRILRALEAGPCTTAQLASPDVGGVRFGARLMELRADGYVITEERVREGSHLYRLGGRPPAVDQGVDLMCSRQHHWKGRVRYCAAGYPLTSTAGPDCPTCGYPAICVEAPIQPARAEVVAAAHDLREAA
jgi:hypothetical protein